jgi:hypothetical protein
LTKTHEAAYKGHVPDEEDLDEEVYHVVGMGQASDPKARVVGAPCPTEGDINHVVGMGQASDPKARVVGGDDIVVEKPVRGRVRKQRPVVIKVTPTIIGGSITQYTKALAKEVDKSIMVDYAAKETKSGVELMQIALGIARDPAALNADRLRALAWIADRTMGAISSSKLATEIATRMNIERAKMLEALRSALNEEEVERIRGVMLAQGNSLEKESTSGPPRGSVHRPRI